MGRVGTALVDDKVLHAFSIVREPIARFLSAFRTVNEKALHKVNICPDLNH